MTQRIPVKIERIKTDSNNISTGLGLKIFWSTGETSELSSQTLRENCPCASCLEIRGDSSHRKPLAAKKNALKVLSATIEEEINLQRVWPVGNYALGIAWGDKHDSGIYTYDQLDQLSKI